MDQHFLLKRLLENLFKAVEMDFAYLKYDDAYQFARKRVKALAEIDGELSTGKLRLLVKSGKETIRKYATKELKYKNLL